jgi:hypothetical protein
MKKKDTAPVVWVVYKSRHAGPQGGNAVCEQAEWDEMEKGWPGGTAAKAATLKAR